MKNLIVIGASAGAVQALLKILTRLPKGFETPVLVAVHIPPDRDNRLIPLLQERCALEIKEAEDKETVRPGVVYVAPPDYHLLVERHGALALSSEEAVNFSRPSIDVLFESAADACGSSLTAAVLTGANEDGASGLKAVFERGGHAMVEDPNTALVPTMPLAALRACPQAVVLDLEAMAGCFLETTA